MRKKYALRNAVFSLGYVKKAPAFSVAGRTKSGLATWGASFLGADEGGQTRFVIFGTPGAGKTKKIEEMFLREKV